MRKEDGTLPLYVDYRRLNAKTIQNQHPIPRVQDGLDSLGDSKWFSLLDQSKAYHQRASYRRSAESTQHSQHPGVSLDGIESHLD